MRTGFKVSEVIIPQFDISNAVFIKESIRTTAGLGGAHNALRGAGRTPFHPTRGQVRLEITKSVIMVLAMFYSEGST